MKTSGCGCSRLQRFFESLTAGTTLWSDSAIWGSPLPEDRALKALLVVARPDDESECAALIYRITHEIGGIVDQVTITNGESGSRYSAPAEAYYQIPLSQEKAARKHLPRIRRREVLRASRILRIRRNYFLEQSDSGFTFDIEEGLRTWDLDHLRNRLRGLLASQDYDLVAMLLPTSDTHGHRQAVALLVLQAVEELAPQRRPAAIGVRTANTLDGSALEFAGLPGFPLTQVMQPEPAWTFDRTTPLRSHRALDYRIVVNWVAAEHKSQGLFQMEAGRNRQECFWLFEISGEAGIARWNLFLDSLGERPLPASLRSPNNSYDRLFVREPIELLRRSA